MSSISKNSNLVSHFCLLRKKKTESDLKQPKETDYNQCQTTCSLYAELCLLQKKSQQLHDLAVMQRHKPVFSMRIKECYFTIFLIESFVPFSKIANQKQYF